MTSTKRKLSFEQVDSAKTTTTTTLSRESKRFKTTVSQDKENNIATEKKAHSSKREAFANLTNTASDKMEPHVSDALAQHSAFINAEFECEPIVSFQASLKMVQLSFCTNQHSAVKVHEEDCLKIVHLLSDHTFIDYMLHVVENKLNSLTTTSQIEVYDPESLDQSELFDTMSDLWFSFVTRINAENPIKNKKVTASPGTTDYIDSLNKITMLTQTLCKLIPPNRIGEFFSRNQGDHSWDKNKTKKSAWSLLLKLLSNAKFYATCIDSTKQVGVIIFFSVTYLCRVI